MDHPTAWARPGAARSAVHIRLRGLDSDYQGHRHRPHAAKPKQYPPSGICRVASFLHSLGPDEYAWLVSAQTRTRKFERQECVTWVTSYSLRLARGRMSWSNVMRKVLPCTAVDAERLGPRCARIKLQLQTNGRSYQFSRGTQHSFVRRRLFT